MRVARCCQAAEEGRAVLSQSHYDAYLRTIRQKVCADCDERPAGGPPCAARGTVCGVELYLPKLVDSIHEVRRRRMQNFEVNALCRVCRDCIALGNCGCPCPMDSLLLRVVEAVEEADQRVQQAELDGHPCDQPAGRLAYWLSEHDSW